MSNETVDPAAALTPNRIGRVEVRILTLKDGTPMVLLQATEHTGGLLGMPVAQAGAGYTSRESVDELIRLLQVAKEHLPPTPVRGQMAC